MKQFAKQDVLSWTQSSEPNLRTRPEATRSPELVRSPVWNKTMVVAAESPMVGANCRGKVTAVAMGMAKEEGPMDDDGARRRDCAHTHAHEHGELPRFGALS